MDVIPVIDLMGRQVVRAKMGERHLYAPLSTPLSQTSAPDDVVRGLMGLHPFRALYIADLDAIEGRQGHQDVIADLQAKFPGLDLWIDPGIRTASEAQAALALHRATLVIGSESAESAEVLAALKDDPRIILSLDFRGDAFQGDPALFENASLWPQRVIVMTLARVGSDQGPDFKRLASVIARAGSRAVFAAGGLRGRDDLAALRGAGAQGVLVASALHDGRLRSEDLAAG